jgi:hypothetical protein
MDKLMVDNRGVCKKGCVCTLRIWQPTPRVREIIPKYSIFSFFLFIFIGKSTISNDGATIINLLDIVHPAAKTLVDIAKSQDAEVSY